MISEKTYSKEEFYKAVPELAQALINKISERAPDAKLNVRQDGQFSFLITIENGHKSEHYQLKLAEDSKIESTSVYM